MADWEVHLGNNINNIPNLDDESIRTVITSPPYFGLRNYGDGDEEIGLEETPEEFVSNLCDVFDALKPKLTDDGTMWINLGDTYASNVSEGVKKFGSTNFQETRPGRQNVKQPKRKITGDLKPKDLIGIPWMFAFEMRKRGWYLRQDIIWSKANALPESVTDRCTKSHEYIFLFSKKQNYHFNYEAIKEKAARLQNKADTLIHDESKPEKEDGKWVDDGTRRKRSVWNVPVAAGEAIGTEHYATYPVALIDPCILAGSEVGDLVCDPFNGSGTTGVVSLEHDRNYVGFELYKNFEHIYTKRLNEAKNRNKQNLTSAANSDLWEW